MKMFRNYFGDEEDDYDRNFSIPKVENYDSMKEYENYHHFRNSNDEEYNSMEEYESGIKHFQDF